MRSTNPANAGKRVLSFFLPLLGLVLISCSDKKAASVEEAPTAVVSEQEATQETADTQNTAGHTTRGRSITEVSKNGLFQVTIQSEEAPLPLNRMHSWTAHIATPEGRVVDDAMVMVYGGMPEHKHGFPSKPQVTANLGNGRYRIEGIKFNMPGRWEMWINVRALGKDDKVIFSFEVP